MVYRTIDLLVDYGLKTGLIGENERIYTRNRLLDILREDNYENGEPLPEKSLSEILGILTDYAVSKNLCTDTTESRDIFDTRLMNCLTPRPSEVERMFWEHYKQSPTASTDYFYKFCGDVNYIRRDRIACDRRWKYKSEFGEMDITINLSKPEKDPRDIAAAGKTASLSYPLCQLCRENMGYAGRIGHPARANHRIIPLSLTDEDWFFQYSPYVYYNEHCIVFNSRHVPMKINRQTFEKMFGFVRQFPEYFIGSNADLPIVGGSILSHDHFQGGRCSFAMEKAAEEYSFTVGGYEGIRCAVIKWPLSVIRLRGRSCERIVSLADHILSKWREYTDEDAMIFAETEGVPHNTITPVARYRGDNYELDLCLRNNLTTEEHPLGLYHPHEEYHHIKKENIGLIEVMGLAVLPSRLQKELKVMEKLIEEGRDISSEKSVQKHAPWAEGFVGELSGKTSEIIRERLEQEVGRVFVNVLKDAGVFKCTDEGRKSFKRFIDTLRPLRHDLSMHKLHLVHERFGRHESTLLPLAY